MAKQHTDDELNLRRKARRRLIGAVALTLVVVVVLPMVLDSEPKPAGKDIELTIPDPDKAGEFIPRVAISDVSATLPAGSAVVASSTPVDAASAVTAPVATQSAAKPSSRQNPPIPDNAQAVSQKSAELQKPAEIRSADKSTASAGSYVAQVGAYANPDTAKQELKKLKSWGFRAYTEKADDKIRVRVGPYPDHDKAEKAGHLLEKHGLHPVIVSAK